MFKVRDLTPDQLRYELVRCGACDAARDWTAGKSLSECWQALTWVQGRWVKWLLTLPDELRPGDLPRWDEYYAATRSAYYRFRSVLEGWLPNESYAEYNARREIAREQYLAQTRELVEFLPPLESLPERQIATWW